MLAKENDLTIDIYYLYIMFSIGVEEWYAFVSSLLQGLAVLELGLLSS